MNVRWGTVSSVNSVIMTARVAFRDGSAPFVSGEMKILKSQPVGFSPWVPQAGQLVVCAVSESGDGFVLGGL